MGKSLVTGIDIGHHSLKAVVIKPVCEAHVLVGYHEVAVTNAIFSDNHKLNYQEIVKKLKELRKGLPWFNGKVAISVPDNVVITKTLQLDSAPAADEEALAVSEAFVRQSAFPAQALSLDFVPVSSVELRYQVYATKRELVEQWTRVLKRAGLRPLYMTTDAQALLQLWQQTPALSERNALLVDVGLTRTLIGRNFVTQPAFYKTLEHRPAGDTPRLDPEQLICQLRRDIQMCRSVHGEESVQCLVLTGGGAQSMAPRLSAALALPCQLEVPWPLLEQIPQGGASFAGALGIALRALHWQESRYGA